MQRSFRLSRRNSELLDSRAELSEESRNALADRVLGEGLRTERYPAVRFRTGAAGRREPAMIGTRLLVRQVVTTVRSERGEVEVAAELLGIAPRLVREAVAYYAEFADEVDADQAWADRVEADERARWERERLALA